MPRKLSTKTVDCRFVKTQKSTNFKEHDLRLSEAIIKPAEIIVLDTDDKTSPPFTVRFNISIFFFMHLCLLAYSILQALDEKEAAA